VESAIKTMGTISRSYFAASKTINAENAYLEASYQDSFLIPMVGRNRIVRKKIS
jgi:hypothetical protein